MKHEQMKKLLNLVECSNSGYYSRDRDESDLNDFRAEFCACSIQLHAYNVKLRSVVNAGATIATKISLLSKIFAMCKPQPSVDEDSPMYTSTF